MPIMKPRYSRGATITDPLCAVMLIMQGKPIYWGNKVQNAGWLRNSQLRVIENAARDGLLAFAHRNGDG